MLEVIPVDSSLWTHLFLGKLRIGLYLVSFSMFPIFRGTLSKVAGFFSGFKEFLVDMRV